MSDDACPRDPENLWQQIWSDNPSERLNREIRRLADDVEISPNRDAIIRFVGGVLAEQNNEWAEGRRCPALDVLARSRRSDLPETATEVYTGAIIALTASPKETRHTPARDVAERFCHHH